MILVILSNYIFLLFDGDYRMNMMLLPARTADRKINPRDAKVCDQRHLSRR